MKTFYSLLISAMFLYSADIFSISAYHFTSSSPLSEIFTGTDDTTQSKETYGWPPDWEVPANTGNFAYAKIEGSANPRINNIPLENGDFIGVFWTDSQGVQHCGGAGEWNTAGLLFPFFGDDPYTPYKDGFSYNEVIKFKIFDWSNNKAYDVPTSNVQYGTCQGCNTSGKFNGLGIHKVINMYLNYVLDVLADAAPDAHCLSGSTQLSSVVTGASGLVTYAWTSTPAGFNSNIPNPVVNPSQTTRYNITVTNGSNTSSHYAYVYIYGLPTVEAGSSGTICASQTFTVSGDGATDYSTLLWTSSGDGTFSDNSVLHPVYTPGPVDKVTPAVKLYLRAYAKNPCQGSVIDSTTINIIPTATVSAGADMMICATSAAQLNATATGYSSVLWTRSGGGTPGTFNNNTVLNPIYTPSTYDLVIGYTNLLVTVQALSPCTAPANDIIMVSYRKSPTCNAGTGGTICASGNFNVNGTANNAGSVLWTSSGDGIFANPASNSTSYTPGTADKTGGTIVLSFTANPLQPCEVPAVSNINLTIRPLPMPNAGNDTTICENSNLMLNGSVLNYATFQWSTSGDGAFSQANTLSPVYNPGAADLNNGSVTITLKAFPISPCVEMVSDAMTLSFQKNPVINAGSDQTICGNQPAILSGTASYQSSVTWNTSGDGVFSSNSSLNTQYLPGSQDIINGIVTLTLTASPTSPCIASPSDQITLSVVPVPTANAGTDNSYCGTNPVSLVGTASSYSSVLWITSGNGVFSQANALITDYIPGQADLNSSYVTITLTAHPVSPCNALVQDQLILTKVVTAQINAGSNTSICEGFTYQIQATAQNYESLFWTTSGTGTFSDPATVNPVYTPSLQDINAGSITLTLNANQNSPCTGIVTSSMILSIQKAPLANSGQDVTLCNTQAVQLNGTAANYSSINWTTSGSGSFSNNNLLNPVYTPSTSDLNTGTVILSLTANPVSPCQAPYTDPLLLTLVKSPANVYAGSNKNTCETNPVHIINSSAINYATLLWTTSGTGTFNNNTVLKPVYSPSIADLNSGSVVLTLTVYPNSPCTATVSSSMTVSLQKSPTVNAGNPQTVCGTAPVQLSASAMNYGSVSWTTSGTGTFSGNNILNPVYSPGAADLNTGSVTLTITVQPLTPCTSPATGSVTLTLVNPASVNAGNNSTICEGSNFTTMATAQHYLSVFWSTSGTGSFTSPNSLATDYIPSQADIIAGSVSLTVSANQNAPCSGVISSSMVLTIQKKPVVNAGTDKLSCANQPVQLAASGTNVSGYSWSSSGSGVFSNRFISNPLYTPSASDVAAGFLTLTVTVSPLSPCTAPSTDALVLTFQNIPQVNAGDDNTYCGTDPVSLNGSAAYYSSVHWSSSGNGGFSDPAALSTQYTPGTDDLNAASVTLTLTGNPVSPCTAPVQDQLILTKVVTAQINAGVNSVICEGSEFQTNATASNYASIFWTTSGTGMFSNSLIINPTYTPSPADINSGTVTLTLSAEQNPPCSGIVSHSITLSIQKNPTANAGADISICNTGQVQLTGAATSSAGINWTTSGTGSFTNVSLLNSIYNPSVADLNAGSVTLTLTATALNPCTLPVSDALTLSLVKLPTAFSGSNGTTCETNPFTIVNPGASNFSSLLWTSTGSGSFNDNTVLNPVYHPSVADVNSGSVSLTLTSFPNSPCTASASHSMTLSFRKNPSVSAGNNHSVCGTGTVQLNATALNYSTILWTSNGSGTFSFNNVLNPVYTPAASDLNNGTVTLTITVQPISPCAAPAVSSLILTLVKPAEVTAGNNSTICEGDSFTTVASAQNYLSVYWSSSGSGSFTSPNLLATDYIPSEQDIAAGNVTLTLHAIQNTPCTGVVFSSMVLSIQKKPLVNAGTDIVSCAMNPVQMTATTSYSAGVEWSASGTGSFNNSSLLNPVYTPSQADLSAGQVTLTVTASALSPCSLTASDNIMINFQRLPAGSAGDDRNYCSTIPVELTGTANYHSSVTWSTSGDGGFSAPNIINTNYIPGPGDSGANSVIISITVYPVAPCTVPAVDNMILTRIPEPEVNSGGPATICENGTYQTTATASNYHSLTWNTSGTGIFSDSNILDPVYIPSAGDINTGTVTLTLSAVPNAPCNAVISSSMVLSIQRNPVCDAGPGQTSCNLSPVTLTGTASHYSVVNWTSAGTGTFSDATLLNTTHTPSETDLNSGQVMLTLTVNALTPCTAPYSDYLVITLVKPPVAEAGPDQSICQDESLFISTSWAAYYSSLLWTTNGDGSFDDISVLTPVYTPGPGDILSGNILLTITAFPEAPCEASISSEMLLSIILNPSVDAGNDLVSCAASPVQLTASSLNSSGFLWTTSGTGTFSNSNILNPVYYPSPEDEVAGSAILTITANPVSPCTSPETDNITVTFQRQAAADAGTDSEICAGSSIPLNATATDYQLLNWTTSGDGTFSNPAIKNPVYTPGPNDIATKTVTLTLSATQISPCTGTISDNMQLTIHHNPEADAGIDQVICGTNQVFLSGNATSFSSLSWTSSGTGSFNSNAVLNPVYTASTDDLANGVVFSLNVYPLSPCTLTATDQIGVNFQEGASVNAGDDMTICENQTISITDAVVSNQLSVLWTTSGDGGFNDPSLIHPEYTPGNSDIQTGQVTLSLIVSQFAPCTGTLTDYKLLTIIRNPEVSAGSDLNTCDLTPVHPVADVSFVSGMEWTTGGSGSFSNSAVPNPTYFPSSQDLLAGSITLTLTVYPVSPCISTASDTITLHLITSPTASAGADISICEGTQVILNEASASNYQMLIWATDGDGTFDHPGWLNPAYTPGIQDIENGMVTLTLTAFPEAPCLSHAVSSLNLTIIKNPLADAGSDFVSCSTDPVQLNGTVMNFASVTWTSSGSGSFNDATLINPIYYPSQEDLNTGILSFTLSASPVSPCTAPFEDIVAVQLQNLPSGSAGDDNSYCSDNPVILSGTAQNYSSILWATSGDGSFNPVNSLSTIYTPGADDINSNSVVITLTIFPKAPCSAPFSDQLVMSRIITAQVNAGSNSMSCAGNSFQTEASASGYSSLFWSTSGTGTFSDVNMVTPVYYPSAQDLSAGSVTLTLSVIQNAPCTGIVTSSMNLGFQHPPQGTAGADRVVCGIETVLLTGTAGNYSGINWSTSGSGTFSDDTSLSAFYNPSQDDLASGTIVISLTVFPLAPCSSPISDDLMISLVPPPYAGAGPPRTICEDQSLHIAASTAAHFSSVSWTTSGTGTFDNPAILRPYYFPGPEDIAAGLVTLTLTAYPLAPCLEPSGSSMTLSFSFNPQIEAGPDISSCETEPIELAAAALNTSSISWTSSGSGTFNDPKILNPVYTPSPADVENGTVELTITAMPQGFCTISATDQLFVTLQKPAYVNAGTDAVICTGSSLQLNGSATDAGSVSWSTSGDGTFINPNQLDAVYNPGPADLQNHSAVLTLQADNTSPCTGSISDYIVITIHDNPTVEAGIDQNFCGVLPVQLNAAATSYSSVLWTTSGDGTFTNTEDIFTTYIPGAQDVLGGLIKCTLFVYPLTPCSIMAVDSLFLQLSNPALVNAGDDVVICAGTETQLSGQVSNSTQYFWSTSGTGTFTNNQSLTSQYIPGSEDITNGSVTLTLTAASILPCIGSVTDDLVVTIKQQPVSNAGPDEYFCNNSPVTLNGYANHYSTVMWTTSGNGIFSNPYILNPVYTPGTVDISSGNVNLTLTVNGISPCTMSATDVVKLSSPPATTVNAGPNATICQTAEFYQLNGTASNYSSLAWSSSGDGYFSDPAILNPRYYLGPNDRAGGSKTLRLNASRLAPCTGSVQGQLTLTVRKTPVITLGPDRTSCTSDTLHLKATRADNQSFPGAISWTTTGTGTFSGITSTSNTLSAIYTPSMNDLTNGMVSITVGINYTGTCPGFHSDQMILYFPSDISIVANPQNITVTEGQTAAFTVSAQANTSIGYQWFGPQGLISGAHEPALILDNISEADSGSYYCQLSNACQVAYSDPAYLFVAIQQILEMPQGWSGISTFVKPVGPSLENMFATVSNDLIILQNNSGVYWPEQGINTLQNWSEISGYQIKLSQSRELTVSGLRTMNRTISLNEGWNYIPVISACPVNTELLFGDEPRVVIVKEIAGSKVYWPELGINTLNELLPGKAYMLYASSDISITYPDCTSKSAWINHEIDAITDSPWSQPDKTPFSHIIGFTPEAMKNLQTGDIIAVFNNSGISCGQMMAGSPETLVLTAFGNDQFTTDNRLFNPDENMHFRLFRPNSAEFFDLTLSFDGNRASTDRFTIHGMSLVNGVTMNPTGIYKSEIQMLTLYPNPAQGKVVLQLNQPEVIQNIILTDSRGITLINSKANGANPEKSTELDLTELKKGVYFISLFTDKSGFKRKLIIH